MSHRWAQIVPVLAILFVAALGAPSAIGQGEDVEHPPADFAAKVKARLDLVSRGVPEHPTWADLRGEVEYMVSVRHWVNPDTAQPWTVGELIRTASGENDWIPDGAGNGPLQRTQMAQVLDALVWRRAYVSAPNGIDIPFQVVGGHAGRSVSGPAMCPTDSDGFTQPSSALVEAWHELYPTALASPGRRTGGVASLGIGSAALYGYSPSATTNAIDVDIERTFLVTPLGGGAIPIPGVAIDRARVEVGRLYRTGPFQRISLDAAPSPADWRATEADFLTAGTDFGAVAPVEVEPPVPPNETGPHRALFEVDPALLLERGNPPDQPAFVEAVRLRWRGEEPPPGYPTAGRPFRTSCDWRASWSPNEVSVIYREALPPVDGTAPPPTASIGGQVVDAKGIGIEGAVIHADGPDGTVSSATTGAGGSYRIEQLEAGRYSVQAAPPDRLPAGGEMVRETCVAPVTDTSVAGVCGVELAAGDTAKADFAYLLDDVLIEAVEVTQGIQDEVWGTPGSFAIPGFAAPVPGATYTGVPLAERVDTIVRVHASAVRGRGSRPAPELPARLHGYRPLPGGGLQTLPGSPLTREAGPAGSARRLRFGPVMPAARRAPGGAYTYRLPPEWTAAWALTLVAEINAPVAGGRPIAECVGCERDDAYALGPIPFRTVRPIRLTPVEIDYSFPGRAQKHRGPDLTRHLDRSRDVLPIARDQLTSDPWPGAVVDVSATIADLAERYDLTDPDMVKCRDIPACRVQYQNAIAAAIERAVRPAGRGHYALGFASPLDDGAALKDIATGWVGAAESRPLSSVTHEFMHLLGYNHGSPGCGGGGWAYDDWPPDQRGLIQGVGFDRRLAASGDTGPNPLVADGIGQPQWFDIMSYCNLGSDSITWISTRTWRRWFELNGAVAKTARATASGAPAAVSRLGVDASVGPDGKVTLLGVAPDPRAATASRPGGSHTIVMRDARGRPISRTTVAPAQVSDAPGSLISVNVLAGARAASVEIVSRGKVLARRTASRRAPRVRLVAPRRRAVLRRTAALRLRWRIRGAARAKLLTTSVQFARGPRGRWRTVAAGLPGTRATLPGVLLAATRRGRLRLVVNDGFRDVATRALAVRVR